jgi:hypothetical protein
VHRHPEFVGLTIWEVFEAERPKLAPADRRDAALSFSRKIFHKIGSAKF